MKARAWIPPLLAFSLFLSLSLATFYTEMLRLDFPFHDLFVYISIAWFIMTVITFYKIVFTPPAKMPHDYVPDASEKDLEYAKERYWISEMKEQKLIDMFYPAQYCGTCEEYRVPRSYHCKKCGCCILRRDHHCVWVGHCVGYPNHKFFIQFVFYLTVLLFIGVCWHTIGFCHDVFDKTADKRAIRYNFPIRLLIFTFEIIFLFAIGMLFGVHFYHLCINTTGQETIELSALRKNHTTTLTHSLYHIDVISNIKSIMGNNIWDWFLPYLFTACATTPAK